MKLLGKKRSGPEVSWGDLHPARRCSWEGEGAAVTLLVPRFGAGKLGRTLERMFQARPYRARLDEIGAFVWRRCDGATSVARIAEEMRAEFGEKIEPAEDRLVVFLQRLLRGKFVSVSPEPEAGAARAVDAG